MEALANHKDTTHFKLYKANTENIILNDKVLIFIRNKLISI